MHDFFLKFKLAIWSTKGVVTRQIGIDSCVRVPWCLLICWTCCLYNLVDDSTRKGEKTGRFFLQRYLRNLQNVLFQLFKNRFNFTKLLKIEKAYIKNFFWVLPKNRLSKDPFKDCHLAMKRQYQSKRDHKMATSFVESWCNHKLYIWNRFADITEVDNDLSVPMTSSLDKDILSGIFQLLLPRIYRLYDNATFQDSLSTIL